MDYRNYMIEMIMIVIIEKLFRFLSLSINYGNNYLKSATQLSTNAIVVIPSVCTFKLNKIGTKSRHCHK